MYLCNGVTVTLPTTGGNVQNNQNNVSAQSKIARAIQCRVRKPVNFYQMMCIRIRPETCRSAESECKSEIGILPKCFEFFSMINLFLQKGPNPQQCITRVVKKPAKSFNGWPDLPETKSQSRKYIYIKSAKHFRHGVCTCKKSAVEYCSLTERKARFIRRLEHSQAKTRVVLYTLKKGPVKREVLPSLVTLLILLFIDLCVFVCVEEGLL